MKKIIKIAALAFVALTLAACQQPTGGDTKSDPTTYIVSFNTDGGSEVASQKVEEDKLATMPVPPTKTGNVFKGWYADAAKTTAFDWSTPITDDITLYANWQVVYTVSFTMDGGEAVAPQTIDSGKLATKPNDGVKTGHTFIGWFADAALTVAFNWTAPIVADTVVYAKWQINQYSVTYTNEDIAEWEVICFQPVSDLTGLDYGTVITLATPVRTPSSAAATGEWKDADTGIVYAAGSTFTIPARNVTLICHVVD